MGLTVKRKETNHNEVGNTLWEGTKFDGKETSE